MTPEPASQGPRTRPAPAGDTLVDGPHADALRCQLSALRKVHNIPGLAAARVHPDGWAVVAVDGLADLRSSRPLDLDSVFAWFSLTKVLTATACVRALAEAGLALDARLDEFAPGLVSTLPASCAALGLGQLQMDQLMSHGAGFRDRQLHAARWFLDDSQAWPDPRDFLYEVLGRRPWVRGEPGRSFHYSNLGYALLGEALAEATRSTFREHIVRNLLKPVGAIHAGFEAEGKVATGHVRQASRMGLLATALGGFVEDRVRSKQHHGLWITTRRRRPIFSPHGGLWGPVGDLVPLLREQLHLSTTPDCPEFDMGRVHQARRGRARRRGEGGLGWRVHPAGPGAALASNPGFLSHGGRGPGFTAEMQVHPEQRQAIAVLGNASFDAKVVTASLLRVPLETQ